MKTYVLDDNLVLDTGNHVPVPVSWGQTHGRSAVSNLAAAEVLHALTGLAARDAIRLGKRFATILLSRLDDASGMTDEEAKTWLAFERERCRALGIRYDGEQDNGRGGHIQCYTDLVTGSSFCVTNDNDIPARLEAMRKQFASARSERATA